MLLSHARCRGGIFRAFPVSNQGKLPYFTTFPTDIDINLSGKVNFDPVNFCGRGGSDFMEFAAVEEKGNFVIHVRWPRCANRGLRITRQIHWPTNKERFSAGKKEFMPATLAIRPTTLPHTPNITVVALHRRGNYSKRKFCGKIPTARVKNQLAYYITHNARPALAMVEDLGLRTQPEKLLHLHYSANVMQ